MANLVFFRQARVDGGVRTGIDVDGSGMEHYEIGSDEHDPALLWYVDLRVHGDQVPEDAEDARQWLLSNEEAVTATYRQLAQKLEVGMDPDVWPLEVRHTGGPAGASLVAVCSCMRRVSAREISPAVREMTEHWQDHLRRLPQAQHQ